AGYTVIHDGSLLLGALGTLDACVAVFKDTGNTCVILFSAGVGSLVALLQRSGGVEGFVTLARNSRVVRGRRSAGLLTLLVGSSIFIETSISAFVTGAVGRPLFDKLRISREKLAYVCDTASAPICILIPLNGWGAFILAQLGGSSRVEDPVAALVCAIPLNFYAMTSLLLLLIVVVTGKDLGPMRVAERRARDEGKLLRDGAVPMISDDVLALKPDPDVQPRAINMILPLLFVVAMVPLGLAYTGVRNAPADQAPGFWSVLESGSGSTAVFWSVTAGVAFAGLLYRAQRIMGIKEFVDVSMKGASALVPLAVLMMLAFAIGSLCRHELHTGDYVAALVGDKLASWAVAPVVFLTACGIAFSTGTSFGTFAIMLAVAIPLADAVGVRQELAVAAVLSGGVFGDHCSPISDTTIISSMASASDHIDHVRTQLPYALMAGGVSAVLFAVAGAVL
ncbi:MAG: Na+/H+ antiporter NhaC family protein, partial [Phycisphaerae bacterium]